jgi:hypothetical protein
LGNYPKVLEKTQKEAIQMSFSIWSKQGRKWVWLSFTAKEDSARKTFEDYCHPRWDFKDVALVKGKLNFPKHIISEKVLLEHGEIIERKC